MSTQVEAAELRPPGPDAADAARALVSSLELETNTAARDRRHPAAVAGAAGPAIKTLYAIMAGLLIAYAVLVIVRSSGQTWPVVDGWGVAGFEVVASLLCASRALVVRDRGARLVPLALGIGLLAWATGDLLVAATGGTATSSPPVSNVLYIAYYPITYVAVMLLLRRRVRQFSVESWLDGGIVGLGAAALCAAFLFHSVLHATDGTTAMVATNMAFPVGDLLLLALVLGGTAVVPGRLRLPWLLLALGYACNTLGDTANLFATGIGATHLGVVANAIAWPTSTLLVSMSAWINSRPSAPLAREPEPSFVLPGLASVAALATLFVGSLDHVSLTALCLAVATLVIAVLRAGLSVTNLRALTADRHRQAVTDQLTSLSNRRALHELFDALEHERHDDMIGQRKLVLLFIDLNRFKEVNDSFGHSVGDELLQQLGERLRGALRSSDILARLGGDEFVATLLDADADYGAMVAQRISQRLSDPFQLGSVRARIGASIGIAVAPRDATDASDLLRCADLAMYRAKVEGKAFAIYNREVDGFGNRMGLVADLRGAIEQRELEVHYQPQIDLANGTVVALEALVRWHHPRLGNIPPLEFLPLAEDADLMDPLTDLVLDKALDQCAAWRRGGHQVAVCVNLSTTNLLNSGLAGLVRAALDRYELPAEALVLEITETTLIADFERSKHTIEALRDLGLVVSVDDFGAGFTSLAYLSSLAVGELKLDRSFIHDLAASGDARNLALVRSTIDLAHALGLRVVAEGVEDADSFDLLVGLRCDLAQGYLISKPKLPENLDLAARHAEQPSAPVAGDAAQPSAPEKIRVLRALPAGSANPE